MSAGRNPREVLGNVRRPTYTSPPFTYTHFRLHIFLRISHKTALFLYFSIIWFGSFCVCVCVRVCMCCVCVCACFPLAIGTRCVSGVVFKQAGEDPDKHPSEAPCTRTRTLKAEDLKMDLHTHRGLRSIATNIYG